MIPLLSKPNTIAATSTYPFGKSKDNTGTNDGTPLNANTLEDWHQFFEKMMAVAAVAPNGVKDNAYDGFQLYEALVKSSKGYKSYVANLNQVGGGAFSATIMGYNTLGTINFTDNGDGSYSGVSSGLFTAGKTWVVISNGSPSANKITINAGVSGTNNLNIFVFDSGASLLHGVLVNVALEIRVYP